VLAIQATRARPAELEFLPGLAFAVILATNLLLVFGSLRARRPTPAAATTTETNHETQEVLAPRPAAPGVRRRRVINVVLLAFLAIGGVVLWYGNRPSNAPKGPVETWILTHLSLKR
jgi:hypothetical protein